MSKRALWLLALAGGAVVLSGCVVVPEHRGYGYGRHPGVVRVAPPPVVVVPPPRHRHWERRGHRHDRHDERDGHHDGRYYGR